MKIPVIIACISGFFCVLSSPGFGADVASPEIIVSVTGGVRNPGLVKLKERGRLLEAVARCEGFDRRAIDEKVSIKSKGGSEKTYHARENPELKDGDAIFVPFYNAAEIQAKEPNQTPEPTAPSGRGSS